MECETLDYRNGKYQGNINSKKHRNGIGIFIDDDLTFYASHWKDNKLHGQTLLYITHGKYIYGEWNYGVLQGLAVFRCGDTVLVGQFNNNFPIGRCMLIFERFNFVCVIQPAGKQWSILQSGTITNHKMLLKYIEKIGITVPDHYFSLTKFACNFTFGSSSLKTYPCYVGCCYFGFINGLAMVFNSNNGLVAIGKHTNDDVSEFGGKFENSRNGCEGNFEQGGERVEYEGVRPANQIYPIFQKLHIQSLHFVNQYFDSKVKIFSGVETMLRTLLKKITQECKTKYSFSAELNDSLDYQEYTEEQSFKLNEIRQNMYQPIARVQNNKKSSNKTPKSVQQSPKDMIKQQEEVKKVEACNMFLRKYSQKSKDFQNGKDVTQNKQNLTSKLFQHKKEEEEQSTPAVYLAKRSPFKPSKHETKKQSSQVYSPFSTNKDQKLTIKQKQELSRDDREAKQPTKPQPKARPNNHRYLMNNSECPEDIDVKSINTKNNSVYKQAHKKQESPDSFKLPTFKALGQSIGQIKQQKENNTQHLPQQAIQKTQAFSYLASASRKKIDVNKPSYQNIEQRRKRILNQYKDMNNNISQKIGYIESNTLKKYQSPFDEAMFSLPKEEGQTHTNPALMPLSLFSKSQERTSPLKALLLKHSQDYALLEKENKEKYQQIFPNFKKISQNRLDIEYKKRLQEKATQENYQATLVDKFQPSKRLKEADIYALQQQQVQRIGQTLNGWSPKPQRKKSYQYVYD